MELFTLGILGLSGVLLAGAGGNRLVRPSASFCLQHYLKQPGIKLSADVDMLSEMRGEGAFTLFAGLTILAGTLMPALRPTSFGVGVVIFGGFALGRAISMAADGRPNKDLVVGTITEVVFGSLHAGCLVMALS